MVKESHSFPLAQVLKKAHTHTHLFRGSNILMKRETCGYMCRRVIITYSSRTRPSWTESRLKRADSISFIRELQIRFFFQLKLSAEQGQQLLLRSRRQRRCPLNHCGCVLAPPRLTSRRTLESPWGLCPMVPASMDLCSHLKHYFQARPPTDLLCYDLDMC